MIKNLPQIVLLNIVGLALFLSWYIPVNHGFWLPIDADIFYFFNQKLVESKAFLWLVALWILILATTVAFYRISKPAAWLMLPYLVWVAFAGYLNLGVWWLNR